MLPVPAELRVSADLYALVETYMLTEINPPADLFNEVDPLQIQPRSHIMSEDRHPQSLWLNLANV
jgi:hypothetical protein